MVVSDGRSGDGDSRNEHKLKTQKREKQLKQKRRERERQERAEERRRDETREEQKDGWCGDDLCQLESHLTLYIIRPSSLTYSLLYPKLATLSHAREKKSQFSCIEKLNHWDHHHGFHNLKTTSAVSWVVVVDSSSGQ